jgi:signal peptidase II
MSSETVPGNATASTKSARAAGGRRGVAWRTLLVALVAIGVDQLTKHTIGTAIGPGSQWTIVPGVVHFVYARNSGVAFSMLAGAGDWVYAVVVCALLVLVVYMLRRPARRLVWLPTGMLIGGAIGNLIDRVARGEVIDFIKLPHWPPFNFADMSITFGVIILVLVLEVFTGPEDNHESKRRSAGA